MVTVTREFADRLADAARLLEDGAQPAEALERLAALATGLLPGSITVAVTIAGGPQPMTSAASDPGISELHQLQFTTGEGPAAETLLHNEPRRVEDTGTERRWPAFCLAAARAGVASCLALPLDTGRQPAGAIALYGREPRAFTGAVQDVAMLLAAQGGTALHNAALYRACRQMVGNLHTALESQAIIEQAKGVLHAEFGVTPDEAFRLLSQLSQNTNRKVRVISAELVAGRIDAARVLPAQGARRGDGRRPRA